MKTHISTSKEIALEYKHTGNYSGNMISFSKQWVSRVAWLTNDIPLNHDISRVKVESWSEN